MSGIGFDPDDWDITPVIPTAVFLDYVPVFYHPGLENSEYYYYEIIIIFTIFYQLFSILMKLIPSSYMLRW